MLEFNVAQLLMAPQGTRRRFDFADDARVLPEPTIVGPVRGEVTLTRTGQGILADCRFETAMALECGRCLEPATMPVSGQFREEYVQVVDVRTGTPLPEVPDTDAFTIDANHSLDLGEAIRQNVLVATPLQPLCQPGCQGLCMRCGQDLNEQACACDPTPGDSPFSVLQELMKSTDQHTPPAGRGRTGGFDGRRTQA